MDVQHLYYNRVSDLQNIFAGLMVSEYRFRFDPKGYAWRGLCIYSSFTLLFRSPMSAAGEMPVRLTILGDWRIGEDKKKWDKFSSSLASKSDLYIEKYFRNKLIHSHFDPEVTDISSTVAANYLCGLTVESVSSAPPAIAIHLDQGGPLIITCVEYESPSDPNSIQWILDREGSDDLLIHCNNHGMISS